MTVRMFVGFPFCQNLCYTCLIYFDFFFFLFCFLFLYYSPSLAHNHTHTHLLSVVLSFICVSYHKTEPIKWNWFYVLKRNPTRKPRIKYKAKQKEIKLKKKQTDTHRLLLVCTPSSNNKDCLNVDNNHRFEFPISNTFQQFPFFCDSSAYEYQYTFKCLNVHSNVSVSAFVLVANILAIISYKLLHSAKHIHRLKTIRSHIY